MVAVQRGAIAEVRREVGHIRHDIDELQEQQRDTTDRIALLSERQARTEGDVQHLVRAYELSASVAATAALADVEIRKANALAQIKERGLEAKHRRAVRREIIFKAVTIAMGLWALLYSILQKGC